MVFNGREFSKQVLADLKKEISSLDFVPEFSDILVGEDGPSLRYVKMKAKTAEEIGIHFVSGALPINSSTEDVISKIKELSLRPNMCGIIVQLPLPEHLNTDAILNSVPLPLDVDGLSSAYSEKFYTETNSKNNIIMPTVLAVKKILDVATGGDLSGKKIAIVGQGRLVGKPVTHLLFSQTSLIETIERETSLEKRKNILSNADIIITAVGSPGVVTGDDIKDGAIVIDAGTLEVGNVLLGDADFASMQDKVSFITPTPGGVGPVTVASLMENVLTVAKNKKNA